MKKCSQCEKEFEVKKANTGQEYCSIKCWENKHGITTEKEHGDNGKN